MAMMIGKFNKLLRSRLIWGAILVLVVLAFVVWGMRTPDPGERNGRQTVAMLDGEPVAHEEYTQAYMDIYLSLAMILGEPPDREEFGKELDAGAWRRLATLRAAQQAGISTSDEEVVVAISGYDVFQDEDGRFDPYRYQAFVTGFLRNLRITERRFEEHVRRQLTIQKINSMIQSATFAAPLEIERTVRALTDTFELQTAELSGDNIADRISVGEEDARNYFEQNRGEFRMPQRVKVRVARIPASRFMEEVQPAEGRMREYYQRNRDKFRAADAEDSDPGAVLPFEDVKEDVEEILAERMALRRAADAATELVISLTPDREGRRATFEEAARKFSAEIETIPPFSEAETPAGFEDVPQFTAAAFRLRANPEEYFSDALIGEEHAYVIALEERLPPRLPEFEEVRREAIVAARRDARERILDEEAAQLIAAPAEDFPERARRFGYEVNTYTNISAMGDIADIPHGRILLQRALVHNQGELFVAAPMPGTRLAVHVAGRRSSPEADEGFMREYAAQAVRQERAQLVLESWRKSLVAPDRLQRLDRRYRDTDSEPVEL